MAKISSVLQEDTFGSILASVQVDTIGKDCMKEDFNYLYKDSLPVGFLGLVDDIIGVTEVGFKAQMMNAFMNVKTAEKTLQFGPSKCKSMLVGKDTRNVINNEFFVDTWNVKYVENKDTGEDDLVQHYGGQIPIGKTDEQRYLGFVLSSKGDNMANINHMKKKANGVIKNIFSKLNSLNLRDYYFECSLVLMNTVLRGTILYASDMYYNMKEMEYRQIERIEECFLRKLFKTTKGCPITQLYFEIGQYPARFEIQKLRCLYLKNILNQDENSRLYKFFKLQLDQPTRGDWVSTVIKDLEEFEITQTFEEIKQMSKSQFSNILKLKVKQNALKYLLNRQKSKGKEIKYENIRMAEYLLPYSKLSVSQKQKMFEI